MKLSVEKSALLLIKPDPTGQLRKGQCAVHIGCNGEFLEQKVVIVRHPIYQKECLRTLVSMIWVGST